MYDKDVLRMLSSILVCMVDRGDYIQIENDAPPEKIVRLEDVVQIIEDFKREVESRGANDE